MDFAKEFIFALEKSITQPASDSYSSRMCYCKAKHFISVLNKFTFPSFLSHIMAVTLCIYDIRSVSSLGENEKIT